MKKLIRGLLGILVTLPGTYLALFAVGSLYSLLINFIFDEGPPIGFFFHHFDFFWRLLVISVLLTGGLVFISMIHICVTNRLDSETKGFWLLILLMGNVLTVPLYWYFNIWRQMEVTPNDAAQQIVGPERGSRVSQRDRFF